MFLLMGLLKMLSCGDVMIVVLIVGESLDLSTRASTDGVFDVSFDSFSCVKFVMFLYVMMVS